MELTAAKCDVLLAQARDVSGEMVVATKAHLSL